MAGTERLEGEETNKAVEQTYMMSKWELLLFLTLVGGGLIWRLGLLVFRLLFGLTHPWIFMYFVYRVHSFGQREAPCDRYSSGEPRRRQVFVGSKGHEVVSQPVVSILCTAAVYTSSSRLFCLGVNTARMSDNKLNK